MLGMSFAAVHAHEGVHGGALGPLVRNGAVDSVAAAFRVQATMASPAPLRRRSSRCVGAEMLALAGSEADGTITRMTVRKTLRESTPCRRSTRPRRRPGGKPRVVTGLPICVTNEPAAARARRAGNAFSVYAASAVVPRDASIARVRRVRRTSSVVGDERGRREADGRLSEAGVTDSQAAIFPSGPDAQVSIARTRSFLVSSLKKF